eukprot:Pgem_evm1s3515
MFDIIPNYGWMAVNVPTFSFSGNTYHTNKPVLMDTGGGPLTFVRDEALINIEKSLTQYLSACPGWMPNPSFVGCKCYNNYELVAKVQESQSSQSQSYDLVIPSNLKTKLNEPATTIICDKDMDSSYTNAGGVSLLKNNMLIDYNNL